MDFSDQIAARKQLMKSARYFIHHRGWSRYEWETDPDVVDFADSYGLRKELEHISKLAFDGFQAR